MISYKDTTFCSSKVEKHTCSREFTEEDAKKAEEFGGVYLIPREEITGFISTTKEITDSQKKEIKLAVKKIVEEYGDALRMLGKE